MEILFYISLMCFTICVRSSMFYLTNTTYTWHEAVRNPPCHIVGMTQESIDAFSLIDPLKVIIRIII